MLTHPKGHSSVDVGILAVVIFSKFNVIQVVIMQFITTRFQDIEDAPAKCPCPNCKIDRSRQWIAKRCAIDIDSNGQTLLKINIGVYFCTSCKKYYRFQPNYLKPRALFSNRVMNIAVASIIEDGMPICKVSARLKRDFGLVVSESSIREWVSKHSELIGLKSGAQSPIVLSEASGVLCVDETYSGNLAVLIATDPLKKDQLIGYMIGEKSFTKDDVEKFFSALKETGIYPDQIVTDESALYPTVVKEVWPNIRHQLCLFHMTQKVTELAKKAVRALRKSLPEKTRTKYNNNCQATPEQVAHVLKLIAEGISIRKTAIEAGVSRNSVRRWLRDPEFMRKRYKITNEIETKVKKFDYRAKPKEKNMPLEPPEGWKSWEHVRVVKVALWKLSFSISSRVNFENEKIQKQYQLALQSPIELQILKIREFVEHWHSIWFEKTGRVESVTVAKKRWDNLKKLEMNSFCKEFESFQNKMTEKLFESLSVFFYDQKFQTTSNSAERYARNIKKIQKNRYRIRSHKNFSDNLLLTSLSKANPLKYMNLKEANPWLSPLAIPNVN